MARTATAHIQPYRQSVWGSMDRLLRNCFVGSAVLGLAVLIAVFVAPQPPVEQVTVDLLPERFARLILEKPQPVAPVVEAPVDVPMMETPRVEAPKEKPKPKPPPRKRLNDKPKVAENKGVQGRQKAQTEVKQNLAEVTGSLDKVLTNLSKSLPASETQDKKAKPRRRRRGVSSGRSSQQLASVQGISTLGSADVSGSAIESDGISIAAITDLDVNDGATGGSSTAGSGSSGRSSGGEYRSSESLLGVVRRYAPGIQFCYDNELKKNPSVRGKLVVSLTVLPDGSVSDAIIVENSLKSKAVTDCVLSQIRGWQFPAIPQGTTSFKTPFVFTPPD